MNKYFHKEINLIKMQIKSALFCLATILVVFTSAAPVGSAYDELVDSNTVSKNDVKNPLKDVNAEVLVGALTKVADKLKAGNAITGSL
jgi:hypothetical protein